MEKVDVTAHKDAENTQSETSVRLQNALYELNKTLDSSLDIICTFNADGEFVNVSNASTTVLGYTPEELIGTKGIDLVYIDDVAATVELTYAVFEGVKVEIFENRFVHKSGRIVSILWSITWEPQMNLVFCIAKDVTEKKRLEKAVISERDQFFEVFQKAPSAIGLLRGPDHVYEIANPVYLKLIGKEDIIGKSIAEVLPEIIDQGFIDILDHVYQTGEPNIGQEILVKVFPDESEELRDIYMDYVFHAFKNADGVIEGVFFFLNNVTEEVLSKRKIEKSERFFKKVLENSADMIVLLDADGKTTYASPAVSRKFGYTQKEILELKLMDVVHPEDILKVATFFAQVLEHPEVPMPCPIVREMKKDGSYMWIEGIFTNFLESDGFNAVVVNFKDITYRIIAEQKLRDSEKQYRQIVETAQEGIWLIDENDKTTFVNKKMCEILGYSESEMIGKPDHYFMDDQARERAKRSGERRRNGVAEKLELTFISKSGRRVIAEISANPVFDEEHMYKGALGMVSDITEKKNLEELLEKSNRLARIGSWEIDVEKKTVFWSDITKEIRGAAPDFEPTLETGIGHFHDHDKNLIADHVQNCMDKGVSWDEEYQLYTFTGKLIWVRTIGEPEFVNGKCVKIYGSLQDITERKNAAEKVFQSEAKLKVAQEIAEVGSWEVDLSTKEHSWSDEFYRILEIDQTIVPSAAVFATRIHPEDYEVAIKVIRDSYASHVDSAISFRFFKKNGEIGHGLSQWRFEFDSVGKPLHLYGILRDLTKEKKAENERLKMISDITQRNKDLEQFSYIISHNLRSPVANIIGLTEELKDDSHDDDTKLLFNEALSSDAKRLENVIADLNIILQTKREIIERREVVKLSELVYNIEMSISNLISKENAKVLTDFAEIDQFRTIKSYLQSIFFNLISNSIKYRKPAVDPIIEISSKLHDNKLVIIFKDNGRGIDLVRKGEQVFGLYKRFHLDIEGKGMGLYMVKTQVETLGGKIAVASEVDKGTVFTIEFDYPK